MKSLDGDEVELAKYEGPVVMIVNVASKCGSPPSFSRERWLRPAVEP
jgi:glutathione peroxidase-family protein